MKKAVIASIKNRWPSSLRAKKTDGKKSRWTAWITKRIVRRRKRCYHQFLQYLMTKTAIVSTSIIEWKFIYPSYPFSKLKFSCLSQLIHLFISPSLVISFFFNRKNFFYKLIVSETHLIITNLFLLVISSNLIEESSSSWYLGKFKPEKPIFSQWEGFVCLIWN